MRHPELLNPSGVRRPAGRLALWSIVTCAILAAGATVYAGDILRGGAAKPNAKRADAGDQATATAAAQARANAKDALARTTQALNAAKAMQASAQAAAAARGANNLGPDPNHPGLMLPDVPNGLAVGGLQVEPGGGWFGANLPTQSSSGGRVRVTVTQTESQALLNWRTFNVGRNTHLHFDQSAGGNDVGKWIAFNKVNDPSGSPSQILGSITAPGQVYIINQNGIIFGGASQVNTHVLVASSLPINGTYDANGRLIADPTKNTLITRGLLNNPDAHFLFSAVAQAAGTKGPTEAFTPPPLPANGKIGDVTVQAGAQIVAPTTAANVGGRVVLVGANVTNAGTISTPDGQTILAAGLQVGFDAHRSSDPAVRGLDVYVGAVKDPNSELPEYAGTVTNTGLIDAPRANVTLTGKTIRHYGAIESSTSVSLNGSIEIDASYDAISNTAYDPILRPDLPPFLRSGSGLVELEPHSVIRILPEWSSTESVVGRKLALRSQVNIRGRVVHLGASSSIHAPNGLVAISAGVWDFTLSGPNATNAFVYFGGQIYVDRDAMINVAGSTDISAPLAQHILTVELRGAELASSPLQRDSIFRQLGQDNPDITVDLRKTGVYNGRTWYGTPLADLRGYLGLIQRTVGELTVAGGSVSLNAGGSVVMQQGVVIDVSGGFINYEGGTVKTTRVMHAGRLMDIADATPDMVYDGIFTGLFSEVHARWGVTHTYQIPWMTGEHYEQPYIHGADGGSLAFGASAMALDGILRGATVAGPRQREELPQGSQLALSFKSQLLQRPDYPLVSPTPPTVIFQENASQVPVGPFALDASGNPLSLPADRIDRVLISPRIFTTSGFASLTIENPDGDITIPAGVDIAAPPMGSLTVSAANVTVNGTITAPGGLISLRAYNISPSVTLALQNANPAPSSSPEPNGDRGLVTLGPSAVLNTAGLLVDDRLSASAPLSLPLVTDGGAVNIASYSANLSAGSVIDVSGGIAVSATGARSYGNAGNIVIKTGQDPGLLSVIGGTLTLGSELRGYSGATGGSLSIQTLLIQIGGRALHEETLLLQPDFFRTGGFATFSLTGIGGITDDDGEEIPPIFVAPGTKIEPVALSQVAVLNPSDSHDAQFITLLKPEGMRSPVSVSLNAPVLRDVFNSIRLLSRGDIVFGQGASITTDALGSVSLDGGTVAMFGSIVAPGGSIRVEGESKYPLPDLSSATHTLATVYLAPGSLLSTKGKTIFTPDQFGRNTGTVLPGGSITVGGNIVAAAGAVIDVSGSSDVLDFHPSQIGLNAYLNGPLALPMVPPSSGINAPLFQSLGVPVRVDSDGGSLTFSGGEMLFVDATLNGKAGGPRALGGSLSVSSGRFVPTGTQETDADINLVVTQHGPTIPTPFAPGESAIGKAILDAEGMLLPGMGYFAVEDFLGGGFDSLTLGGNIKFSGPIDIHARGFLKVASGGVIHADSRVNLVAPYVRIGQPFRPPLQPDQQNFLFTGTDANGQNRGEYNFLPTWGPGSLHVTADVLDIGTLSLQGIGEARLFARGDIRGNGALEIAGNLILQAGQIYPTTAGKFTIVAYDYTTPAGPLQGSVTILGTGRQGTPLSAGGVLSIYASNIHQGGVLRAPLGTINLGWDGTGTAPVGPISEQAVAPTQQLTLAAGSVTSVSAVDGITREELLIPYGFSPDGNTWVDPFGIDITAGGVTTKAVNLSARSLTTEAGSLIDISGGGDLLAYRFVPGNSGPEDILASSTSFAVIPGYMANFAPYAPFNSTTADANLAAGESGYVNDTLSVGDRVYLNGSPGLRAGVYTLLPARYALLPGAFLVTPTSGGPIGTFTNADGSSYVAGYRFNDLNSDRVLSPQFSRFEVAPASTFLQRAEYQSYLANTFLREGALAVGATVPRLPQDGGYLLLQASQAMRLDGNVNARAGEGGRGGLIDISSVLDIFINDTGTSGGSSVLTLSASKLSSFGAESLLIGGFRTFDGSGTSVTVRTGNLTLDNPGSPLTGPEIILAANETLTLAPGSSIVQAGTLASADALTVTGVLELGAPGESIAFARGGTPISFPSGTPGNDRIISTVGGTITSASGATSTLTAGTPTTLAPGSTVTLNEAGTISFASGTAGAIPISIGDGALVRVSADPSAVTQRTAVAASTQPNLVVGAGVLLQGGSLTLDSTYATSLHPTATLDGDTVNLNSGQISIQFDNPGVLQPTVGLVLAGNALDSLRSANSLSLLSYSSIDLYGTGQFSTDGSLALHAAEIRGFNHGTGTVSFGASSIALDNSANVPATDTSGPASGTLEFNAGVIQIGSTHLLVNRYASLVFNANEQFLFTGTGGLTAQQDVTVTTPAVGAARSAVQALTAGGALVMQGASTTSRTTSGLGASLTLQGASVVVNTNVSLPSGLLAIRALTGDLTVGGRLDVGGTAQTFYDVVKYTDAGEIMLAAEAGAVSVLPGAVLNASADPAGGDAGKISIISPASTLSIDGQLLGVGGANGGRSGTLVLDVGRLEGGLLSSITPSLVGFNESRSIRDRLDALVTIDGVTTAQNFTLSADSGTILVTGTVDAHGITGGTIALRAHESVILQSGSLLDASAQTFSNAGKGGAVYLEAGSQKNGVIAGGASAPTGWVDIRDGSIINLSVAENTPVSASLGWLTGTLHLRAPQIGTALNNVSDVAVETIEGNIIGASSILVEGYWLFDLTSSGGAITTTVQNSVRTNGNAFVGVAGSPSPGYNAMFNRIVGTDPNNIAPLLVIAPGAEIINRSGNLTLGATNSNASADWNLGNTTAGQRFRFGPKEAPGVLTLRAAGNLVLFNTISDGFISSLHYTTTASNLGLLPYNPNLPLNLQSWSYRFAAGSDVQAVDFHQVHPLADMAANSGSLLLGKNGGANTATGGANAQTSTGAASAVGNPTSTSATTIYKYQAIRTGTGSIDIAAARDVQLLNQFAVIFTAGVQVQDPTMGGTFDVPRPNLVGSNTVALGAIQQNPPAPVQYTFAGGSISITAGNDITHLTRNTQNVLIADSSREMPTNWLYRRGAVDPLTGLFTESRYGVNSAVSDVASTTWWIDFANFFEGVGALGGGDVTLIAGRDVSNVDALIPTNARMPGKDSSGNAIAPNASSLVELGGGDLTVLAGRNIDGGVYYVERGTGTLFAGNEITTNSTRSPSRGFTTGNFNNPDVFASETWLPTTLFVGKSTFDVSARGNVLMGPVANAFLMPQGYNNTYWYKTYFSTYAPDSGVKVSSLGGTINLRKAVTLPASSQTGSSPVLYEWFRKELLLVTSGDVSVSVAQPWLRLSETNLAPFRTVMDLMAPTLEVTAFSGDINTVGQFILSPSSTGSLEFLAGGAINGLRPTGNVTISGTTTKLWSPTRITVSDTDPAGIYSITQPLAYQNLIPSPGAGAAQTTQATFLDSLNQRFAETGSSTGSTAVLQFKQALHAPGILHKDDPDPVRIYADGGDISALTVFSPKAARIFAERDITDIAFYIQNTGEEDISIVAAGRDIVAYNPSSPARVQAATPGNLLNAGFGTGPLAGDLQVSGPGTLEVLAGRDLSLGSAAVNADGTGSGITSIGNARNPYLPFEGANLVVGAGLGGAFGLSLGAIDVETFISEVLEGPEGARYFAELGAESNGTAITDVDALNKLEDEERARIALDLFFIALRDAGRDFETTGNYDAGFAAIEAMFPDSGSNEGDISTFSRDIRTKSGGSIGIIAPGGGLTLGNSIAGNPEVPPGVVTESGGSINIFTHNSVDVGISRIFTLRGGNIMMWSSTGDIAAGSSAKTVQSAPPTRVLIDPQSADITTDLAGLATGGGIGVLATVKNVPPGDVDLIAPVGTVDAGDAGIRATGNLSIAAATVLNASNIAVGGTSTGTPAAPVVAAPNIGGLATASNTAGQATSASQTTTPPRQEAPVTEAVPSIIVVEVLGYGGGTGSGTGDEEDEEEKRRRRALETQESTADQAPAPPTNPAR